MAAVLVIPMVASSAAASQPVSPYDPGTLGFGTTASASLTVPSGSLAVFDTITGQVTVDGNTIRGASFGRTNDMQNGIGVAFNVGGTPGTTSFVLADLNVQTGATLRSSGVGNPNLGLFARHSLTVAGTVSVDGAGAPGGGPDSAGSGIGAGSGGTAACPPSGGNGASFGGLGGSGGGNGAPPSPRYGSLDQSLSLVAGSGGGGGGDSTCGGPQTTVTQRGGSGGGGVALVSLGTLTINGTVSATGNAPAGANGGGGGGSGGAVVLMAPALSLNAGAVVLAPGGVGGQGAGSDTGPGGGGGGGGAGGRVTGVSNQPVDLTAATILRGGGGGASSNGTGLAGNVGTVGTLFQRPFLVVEGPTAAKVGDVVQFSAAPTIGAVSSASWDFGDGTGTSTSPTHTYTLAGRHTVVVTATMDDSGAVVAGQTTIDVAAPPTLTGIAVTPASPTVTKGSSQQFSATGTYSDGSTADLTNSVTWGSSTTSVATVSTSGLADALAQGTTTISAAQGSVTATTTLTVPPESADLGVGVVAPSSATKGSIIAYTITLANNGPSDAVHVVFTDQLPVGTAFESVTAPSGWSCTTPAKGKTGTVTCALASMQQGTTMASSLFVKVKARADSGGVNNVISVASDTPDPNTGNNRASATTLVVR